MVMHSIKNLSCLVLLSFSIQAFAAYETINVRVETNDRAAAALGFTVEGKKSGAPGKSYSGKGPVNKKYVFGYRKHSPFGSDILCGSSILSKDSKVTIVAEGEQCSIVVN